ncbi:MAG: hypothetical protein AAGA89_07420, partial [Pseudomonadota bacterium]
MSILSRLTSTVAAIALTAGTLAPVAYADRNDRERRPQFSSQDRVENRRDNARAERNRQARIERREGRSNVRTNENRVRGERSMT